MLTFLVSCTFVSVPLFTDPIIYPKNVSFVVCGTVFSLAILVFMPKLTIKKSFLLAITVAIFLYLAIRIGNGHHIRIAYIVTGTLMLVLLPNIDLDLNIATIIMELISIATITVCLLQYAGLMTANNPLFITALFDNPSGISILLTLCFPFIFCRYLQHHNIIETVLLFTMIIALIMIGSRSAVFVIIIVALKMLHQQQTIKSQTVIYVICGIALFFVFLLWVKNNSTLGRWFVLMQSLSLIFNDFWIGSGIYGFYRQYMNLQADYFHAFPNSIFKDLADETMHPLNEYVSFFISFGILGILLLVTLFWQYSRSYQQKHTVYHSCLLSIILMSIFTYTFRYSFVWFFVLLCISQIIRGEKSIQLLWPCRAICIALCLLALLILIKDISFEYRWHNIASMKNPDSVEYDNLKRSWNGNPFFLYNYAAILNYNGDYHKSNTILTKYTSYIENYKVHLLFAENFYSLSLYDSARIHYSRASLMCPSRFVPLRGLLRTYHKLGNTSKADSVAHYITKKQPKVNSYDVFVIKAEAESYLNQNHYN